MESVRLPPDRKRVRKVSGDEDGTVFAPFIFFFLIFTFPDQVQEMISFRDLKVLGYLISEKKNLNHQAMLVLLFCPSHFSSELFVRLLPSIRSTLVIVE